jgi:hypothetical protein
MKHNHAVRSTSQSRATKHVVADLAKASGEVADVKQSVSNTALVHAGQHSFVVGWELRQWLAAEEDWFPKERTH